MKRQTFAQWWKDVHETAKMNAEYERYQQDTVHNWAEDVMPGEDAEPGPRWLRWLPLAVVHGAYWPLRRWLERFYLTNLLAILRSEFMRVVVCGYLDHDFEDTGSWGGPESGGEDLTCRRCGFHVHHIYY
jgi:hypothetical protein